MLGRLIAITLGLCLLVSCDFHSRSNAFACDTQGSCADGRVCEMGWCVVPGASLADADTSVADANTSLPDAAPDPQPDAAPLDLCQACSGGSCELHCTAAICDYQCEVAGCECTFSCTAGADKCNGECKEDTTCAIDCGGAKQCHPQCKPGSVCDIDCTGIKDCKKVKCEGDAACLLDCTDTMGMDCKFDVCDGVEMSCPNDIKVCGRDCP